MTAKQETEAVQEFNPESLNEFYSLEKAAEIVGIPPITLNYFSELNSIPYKLDEGKKFFRQGSLIRFKNGWEQIPVEGTGERFAKDWK